MRRSDGFTLIELIVVIVLLGIVATLSANVVSVSSQGALDTAARQQRALSAAVISEQISRELRQALPVSVRVSGDGRCLEWFPIVAASTYVDLNPGEAISSFSALALPDGSAASGRVAIYGYGGDLFQPASPGPLSPPATLAAGTGEVSVTLSQPHAFVTGSPSQRFFLVDDPVTLCQSGSWLYRYRNYGIQATVAASLPATAPGREVLAADLVANSLAFTVIPATLQRGAVVQFAFTLADSGSGETTAVSQEVQIRNVP